MITKVLLLALILPQDVILFVVWWRFWHLTKIMAEVENILNDEFFADTILLIQKRVLNSIVNKNVQRFQ